MSNRRIHNRRGFTLIEMMVYISVLAIVSVTSVLTYISLTDVLVRNQTERMLSNSAEHTLERFLRAARSADSVNIGASTFAVSPGQLSLISTATTTVFSLSGGAVRVTENGIDLGPLTSNDVTVDSLLFWHATGTRTELVRMGLTLSVDNRAASSTRTFYTSTVLRGSYE